MTRRQTFSGGLVGQSLLRRDDVRGCRESRLARGSGIFEQRLVRGNQDAFNGFLIEMDIEQRQPASQFRFDHLPRTGESRGFDFRFDLDVAETAALQHCRYFSGVAKTEG